MYDARARAADELDEDRPKRKPAELIEGETDELTEEPTPALELDPDASEPLTDAAAGDGPEVEPAVGD